MDEKKTFISYLWVVTTALSPSGIPLKIHEFSDKEAQKRSETTSNYYVWCLCVCKHECYCNNPLHTQLYYRYLTISRGQTPNGCSIIWIIFHTGCLNPHYIQSMYYYIRVGHQPPSSSPIELHINWKWAALTLRYYLLAICFASATKLTLYIWVQMKRSSVLVWKVKLFICK